MKIAETMGSTERKPGYYRVKYYGAWVIAEYGNILGDGIHWYIAGVDHEITPEEIIKTPISPEPTQPMTREGLMEVAQKFIVENESRDVCDWMADFALSLQKEKGDSK